MSKEIRTLSDFSWASATQYITWLEGAANLVEVNWDQVHSFELAKIGPDKTIAKNNRLIKVIEENIKKLEGFAGRYKGKLEQDDLSVVRSVYSSMRGAVITLKQQNSLAERYSPQPHQLSLIPEEEEDDLPF